MTVVTIKAFMAATGPDLDALVLKLIGWTRKPGESDGALRSAVMDVVRNEGRQFPITHCGEPRTIPWAAIGRFDEQARKNFGQSLAGYQAGTGAALVRRHCARGEVFPRLLELLEGAAS